MLILDKKMFDQVKTFRQFQMIADFVNTSSGRVQKPLLFAAECSECEQPFFMLPQDYSKAQVHSLDTVCPLAECRNKRRRKQRTKVKSSSLILQGENHGN